MERARENEPRMLQFLDRERRVGGQKIKLFGELEKGFGMRGEAMRLGFLDLQLDSVRRNRTDKMAPRLQGPKVPLI